MKAKILALAILLLAMPSLAHAEKSTAWIRPTVGNWDIFVDSSLGNGCFIIATYELGTVLRLGFNRIDSNAYLMIGHRDWNSLEVGKDYEITIKFDRAAPWKATATGVKIGTITMLQAETDKPAFITDFMRKLGMTVTYRNREIASLSLRGSSAAISEMLRCQEVMDTGNMSDDPFATPSTKKNQPNKSDPFSY